MLNGTISAPSRPRPPANKRRTSTKVKTASSPPPPYVASLGFPTQNPPDASIRSLSGELDTTGTNTWFTDASNRNELSQLLHKADRLVKGHGDQPNQQTSSVYKDLCSSSKSLKSKHQEFLNRIPGSPRPTPITSPIISSPHFFSGHLQPDDASTIRRRRISVSPADLTLLSDQNAELLLKIESLEAENDQAERDGRRKMGKLDEEIQYLRAELEQIHAKSDELEERALRGERELQKMERDDRIKELRLSSSHRSDSTAYQDFSPECPLPPHGARRASGKRSASGSSQMTLCDGDMSLPSPDTSRLPTSASNSSPLDTLLESDTEGEGEDYNESALVSKLMTKIEELEATNTRILSQQNESVNKWRLMQEESESIARAYDYLNSDELEIITEDGSFLDGRSFGEDDHEPDVEVMTFRTFRKSLDLGRMQDRLAAEFNAGIGSAKQSTYRQRTVSSPHQRSMSARESVRRNNRNRRSVMGLFNDEERKPQSDGLRSEFLFPRVGESTSRPASEGYPFEPPSPTLSALSITSPSHTSLLQLGGSSSQQPLSLESELGRVWPSQESSRTRHLHSNSIMEMLSLPVSASTSPANSEIALPDPPTTAPPTTTAHRRDRTRSYPVAPRTPSPVRDVRISLQPPTPNHSGELTKLGSADGKRSLRNGRLSQKVRTRADRWEQERFPDSPRARKMSTTQVTESLTLTRALDHVVETLTKSNASEPALSSSSSGTEGKAAEDDRRDRFVAMMFEFWLWLQFIIVIVVFLFALARRGPRSVLKEKQP